MYKLFYIAVFFLLAVLDWRSTKTRTSPLLYFSLFAVATLLAGLSVWFVQDLSLARLLS